MTRRFNDNFNCSVREEGRKVFHYAVNMHGEKFPVPPSSGVSRVSESRFPGIRLLSMTLSMVMIANDKTHHQHGDDSGNECATAYGVAATIR